MDKISKLNDTNEKLKINVIGFSGKIGSGKNYIGEQILGKYLNDKGYRVHSIAFADQIKYEIACRSHIMKNELIKHGHEIQSDKIYKMGLFNILYKYFLHTCIIEYIRLYFNVLLRPIINVLKSIIPINLDYNKNYKKPNLSIKKTYDLVFKTKPKPIRLKLQKHAEEREINSEVWINSLALRILNIQEKSYDKEKDVFIITDVRFKNEIYFIKSIGGIVIRIIPENKTEIDKNNEINKHISETELDNYEGYDLKIKNTFDDNINISKIINKIIYK